LAGCRSGAGNARQRLAQLQDHARLGCGQPDSRGAEVSLRGYNISDKLHFIPAVLTRKGSNMRLTIALALALALSLWVSSVGATCRPGGMQRGELLALKAAQWQVPSDARRQQLALDLVECLADPDPVLRDEVAFEALSAWMRDEKLTTATVQALRTTLLPHLKAADPQGFARPFAALVLAEVARVDRRKPYLSPVARQELVAAAAAYLSGVRDYRGFEPQAGWRHGVAHGADLMLQLALNPALGRSEHEAMLAAIASQVLPSHFYIYGEGERLMAPVFYLARRDTLTATDWEAWLSRLVSARQPTQPASQAALAQAHNLKQFLYPLFAALSQSPDAAQRERLLPALIRALKTLD
jgi:hypothetical protein